MFRTMTQKKKILVKEVEKIWMSTDDVVKYLGVGKDFIGRLRLGGQLPHCRIGNAAFFLRKDIDALLEKNRVY